MFGLKSRLAKSSIAEARSSDTLLNKLQTKEAVRVTVTGAAGAIGYALLFRLANGELLGPQQPIVLNCLELPMAMDALRGVAMELEDSAFPLLQEVNITSDSVEAFDGCEIALMVGSKPRGPGMERGDLLKENGKIFQALGGIMNAKVAKYCRVTVVGNPCNTNCYILANNCPDIPERNFTAMTRLDHDRGVGIIAKKAMLPVAEVNKFAIWGNHSATMFPDLTHTTIHGAPWSEVLGSALAERFWKHEFIPKVQTRGARVIDVRGSSSAASAANASLGHTRDWVLGSPNEDWTSMAIVSQGDYGVPPGLVFSYPVRCASGMYEVADLPAAPNAFFQQSLEANIKELEAERDTVSDYLPN